MWRSRLGWIFGGGSLALIGVGFPVTSTPKADVLLRDGRVFEFREAVQAMRSPSSFYTGALAYTFHDWAGAERDLNSFAKSAPFWSRQAYRAASGLENIYSFSGRNAEACAQYNALRWRSIFWNIAEFRIRSHRGDLAVIERGYSQIPYAAVNNGIYIPLTIAALPANYLLDTGSSGSFMSESEARRLGLSVDPYHIQVQGYSKLKAVSGIAVAPEVRIGKFRLRNVPFLVEPDKEVGIDGNIVGMDVMLALQTWRWGPDGIMEVGFPSEPLNIRAANMAFSGVNLVTRAGFGNDKLELLLDTGSSDTDLFPRFRSQYAEYVRLFGHPEELKIDDSKLDRNGTTLPALPLTVGGQDHILKPAPVYSQNPSPDDTYWHGSIGMDFLNLAATVTLDFGSMRLTMAGDGLIPEATSDTVNCTLPKRLYCPVGWTCMVHSGGAGCWLDRLPDKPWPGNSILDGSQKGGHRLDAGFRLPDGKTMSFGFDREPAK